MCGGRFSPVDPVNGAELLETVDRKTVEMLEAYTFERTVDEKELNRTKWMTICSWSERRSQGVRAPISKKSYNGMCVNSKAKATKRSRGRRWNDGMSEQWNVG